ncbi:DMT family transporter [Rickettsia endosymbiont of Cardiosporidium cionae]|uniref:DMT family transporter n=1 Tax=Rickettsia endosymbiont of Cardiosporidium cionae TaxID=2777155 RepID=UPI001895107A|nr:DMT family transporter [Rickettsia endosymbiont of Cardiosporidium cionae]KAF8818489.1 EamA/RhaT family transporter [Rickettsia endosymbiont of Cardiosporidium cionae]
MLMKKFIPTFILEKKFVPTNPYLLGVVWFVFSIFLSAVNDVLSKHIASYFHTSQMTFFRFLFCAITLAPFILYNGMGILKTNVMHIHILRSGLLAIGIFSWNYAISIIKVSTATSISFTIPIFTLVFSFFVLKEKISYTRLIMTCVVFLGLIVTLEPGSAKFQLIIVVFVLSAASFAMLDIINKKFILMDSFITVIFYSSLFPSLVSFPFALVHWAPPNIYDIVSFFLLGINSNLMIFCMFKAFTKTDVSALAPYRYIELFISAVIAYFVLNEIPNLSTIYGILIIMPATFMILQADRKKYS